MVSQGMGCIQFRVFSLFNFKKMFLNDRFQLQFCNFALFFFCGAPIILLFDLVFHFLQNLYLFF